MTFRSDLEFVALLPGMEDDVYRIVQEALHNVVKHAQATAVMVGIAVRGVGKGLLVVDIEDDGVGFHQPLQSAGSRGGQSLGMQSMRERAQRWGGSVVLRGRSGKGGHLRVTIPLPATAGPPPAARGQGHD